MSSLCQRGPDEAGELAGDRGDDMLFGFPARGEPLVATIQPLLGAPRLDTRGLGGRFLSAAQLFSDEGMMAIVPRGFDQDTAQVRIAGLGDRPARSLRAARMLRWDQPDILH